jgi:glutaredoxin
MPRRLTMQTQAGANLIIRSCLPNGEKAVPMIWNWLARRWRRPSAPSLEVVIYTRRGCHLCEDAEELLRSAQDRFGFQLAMVDVDSDPDLAARYGQEVPVVTVAGKVRFRGQVNPVLLERLLGR